MDLRWAKAFGIPRPVGHTVRRLRPKLAFELGSAVVGPGDDDFVARLKLEAVWVEISDCLAVPNDCDDRTRCSHVGGFEYRGRLWVTADNLVVVLV